MKYLVLRRFWSYGKCLEKGQVVDESEIRSPSLRRSEGKITPAVSSQQVPEEFGAEDVTPPVFEGNSDTGTIADPAASGTPNSGTITDPAAQVGDAPKTGLFSFMKKD